MRRVPESVQGMILSRVDRLDPELLHGLRHIRGRGVAIAMEIELDRAPDFPTLTLAPSLNYVERAYDDVKYRRHSAQPWLDLFVQGKRGEVHCQYVPENEQPAAGTVTGMLAPYLPPITHVHKVCWLPFDGPLGAVPTTTSRSYLPLRSSPESLKT